MLVSFDCSASADQYPAVCGSLRAAAVMQRLTADPEELCASVSPHLAASVCSCKPARHICLFSLREARRVCEIRRARLSETALKTGVLWEMRPAEALRVDLGHGEPRGRAAGDADAFRQARRLNPSSFNSGSRSAQVSGESAAAA